MSKSKVVIIVGKKRRGGKRGRNVGTGVYKLSRSRWGSYASLIAHQKSRRLGTMGRRFCKDCSIQFHSRAAYNRHCRKNHLTS